MKYTHYEITNERGKTTAEGRIPGAVTNGLEWAERQVDSVYDVQRETDADGWPVSEVTTVDGNVFDVHVWRAE